MEISLNQYDLERYSRQILFPGIGKEGQVRLRESRVLIIGCGALGTVLAESLTRAGIGFLRIADRDFVETSNLQRQVLFDEEDVREQLPKVEAAARKLRRINSSITIETLVLDVGPGNIAKLAQGVDLILDGTDNFETRFLINDLSLELGIPWIYAGCIGSHGQILFVQPNKTACLRCLMETPPDPGSMETCDTAGILGPTIQVISSLAVAQALKYLSGHADQMEPILVIADVWDCTFRTMSVAQLREQGECPACRKGDRDWLHGDRASQSIVLCGRNAVQISPPREAQRAPQLDLEELERKLKDTAEVRRNAFLLRFRVDSYEMTIFPDGRAIIKGTNDPSIARSIYARYLG